MQIELFEIMDKQEAAQYKSIKSNDWYWHLSDLKNIPKNGLKVFSCFTGQSQFADLPIMEGMR